MSISVLSANGAASIPAGETLSILHFSFLGLGRNAFINYNSPSPVPRRVSGGMSEILELLLDLVFNVIGFLAEAWLEDFLWPDTRISRIFWCIILTLLGA